MDLVLSYTTIVGTKEVMLVNHEVNAPKISLLDDDGAALVR